MQGVGGGCGGVGVARAGGAPRVPRDGIQARIYVLYICRKVHISLGDVMGMVSVECIYWDISVCRGR